MLPLLDIDGAEGTHAAAVHLGKVRPDHPIGQQVHRLIVAQWKAGWTGASTSCGASSASATSGLLFSPPSGSRFLGSSGVEVLGAIKRFRSMSAYGDNWDAEGAPAPKAEVIDAAMIMVGFLEPFGLRIRAALDALGQPMILMAREDGEGEIVFLNAGEISFAWYGSGLDVDGDAEFTGRRLPPALQVALQPGRVAA